MFTSFLQASSKDTYFVNPKCPTILYDKPDADLRYCDHVLMRGCLRASAKLD